METSFLFALVIASLLQESVAILPLPGPSGSNAVGTLEYEWWDRERADPVTGEGPRLVRARIRYPATPEENRSAIPYASPGLVEACRAEPLFEQPIELFDAWLRMKTHSLEEAPPVPSTTPFPVVLVSHGLGLPAALSAVLCEELASHGYVSVALDHPYGGLAVDRDGRVRSTSADPLLEEEGGFERRTAEWSTDFGFALDRLAALPQDALLAGRLGLERVAVVGHSMGGAAAVLAACRDERVVACVNMDGAPFGLEEKGLCAATLVLKSEPIYSEAELEAVGRSVEEWEGMGRGIRDLWAGLQRTGGAPLIYASLRGTSHLSFCDAPFVLPETITAFGGTFLTAERTATLVGDLVREFLDGTLCGRGEPLSSGSRAGAPEIHLEVLAGEGR